jgi:hypothetical protein
MADNLPAGFQLDQETQPSSESTPPVPQGFKLDQEAPSSVPEGFKLDEDSPPEGFKLDQDKYSTPGQQAMTFVEGMGRPIGGDVAIKYGRQLAEKYTNNPDAWVPSPQDVAARAEANPGMAGAGELVGNIAGMKGVGSVLPEFKALGSIGSKALKGGLEMAITQGGEEAAKQLTTPDPNESAAQALAHMGYAGLLGVATGGAFGVLDSEVNKGLKAAENAGIADKARYWLTGLGAAKNGLASEGALLEGASPANRKAYLNAVKFHNNMGEEIAKKGIEYVTPPVVGAIAGPVGTVVGGLSGGLIGTIAGYDIAKKYVTPVVEKILGKPITKMVDKAVVPFITKALTSDSAQAVPYAIEYATQSAKGLSKLNAGLDYVFRAYGKTMFDGDAKESDMNKIYQGIDDGILNQQLKNQSQEQDQTPGYAHGGEVEPRPTTEDHFANTFPNENMVLQGARSRVFNYLGSMKPQHNTNKLAFDGDYIPQGSKRTYRNAVELAANPLSILKKVKDGTITSEHVKHMTSMWPELSQHLSNKITERITEQQAKGEKPPYKIRQGLAMLMGHPLESNMTPMNIMAAQSAFMPKQPPPQPGSTGKPKKDTAKLGSKTNNMYKTQTEAAESDRSARD